MEIIKLGSIYADGHLRSPGFCINGKEKISLGDTVSGQELQWVRHKGILVGDRCACVGISWKQLNKRGYIFGWPVLIDGSRYLCRSLKVGDEYPGCPSEWDDVLDTYGDDNDLWHWRNIEFWGQETPRCASKTRVVRGMYSARFFNKRAATTQSEFGGFRPVLEPLPVLDWTKISGEIRLAVYHKDGSIVEGILNGLDDYDLVLSDLVWSHRGDRKPVNRKTMIISKEAVVWAEVKR